MPNTITVSTQTELLNALKSCGGGDTILLNAGNYGDLSLIDKPNFDLGFSSTVTIAAADPNNPPVVTKLALRGADNLSFDNILFDYNFKLGDHIWTKPFVVAGGSNINFNGCTFDGDVATGLSAADNGFPAGFGLSVSGTIGVTVNNCEITNFYRGMNINNSDNVAVTNNDLHTIRMDGMDFAGLKGILIEGNNIHDFARSLNSTDHADMIQFWTANTTRPSSDIVIRNNILDIGQGQFTQSIFMRNDQVDKGLAGPEMFYQNVLIEGNVIVNGHGHGITVGETAGLTIINNSVLHSDGGNPDGADSTLEIPRINLAARSTNVTVTHNATSAIKGYSGQADWDVSMNAFVQDQNPNAPGWYGDVFVASTLANPQGADAIQALPGGMLTQLGAGAPSQLTGAPAQGTDTTAQGTDTTAQGTDTTAQGTDTPAQGTGHNGNELVSLRNDGLFVAHNLGVTMVLDTIRQHDSGGGIQYVAGLSADVAREHLAPIFAAQDVTISLKMDADAAGTTGEIVRLHQSFVATVNLKGEMLVKAWSSTGEVVTLTSTGQKVNDGNSYDVDVRLEGGRLSLWINDAMVKDVAFHGTFADVGRHDLTFGNPWQSNFFDGDVTEFSIAIDDGITQVDPFTAHAIDYAAPLA